jgi:hypothetical protein
MKSNVLKTIRLWLAIAAMLACHAVASPKASTWITNTILADNRHGGRICSLLAVGGFRASVGQEFASIRDSWLSSHPKAILTRVCQYKEENSNKLTLTYVWILDGNDNLNVELVRTGCVAADYMYVLEEQKIDIPAHKYQEFVQKVRAAESEAKAKRLGIWEQK